MMIMRKYFVQCIGIIEQVFGIEWLNENASRAGRGRAHPVRVHYQKAKRQFGSNWTLPRDARPFESLSFLSELGVTLSKIVHLPGFERQLLKRFLLEAEYPGAYYEARIARRHAEAGHDVRFIDHPGRDARGTDLRIVKDGKSLLVEAKYKDRIEIAPFSDAFRQHVVCTNDDALRECPSGVDVTALVSGNPSEAEFSEAASKVVDLVKQGFVGTRLVADPGLWLCVKKREAVPPPVTREKLESLEKSRSISIRLGQGPDGEVVALEGESFGMFCLTGHKIDSVLDNIKEASKQIGPQGLGIVCVDVDSGSDSIPGMSTYLKLIGDAVSKRTWGGGRNTRIRALVISSGPHPRESENDGYQMTSNGYIFCTIFNPEISYPPVEDETASFLVDTVLAHSQS